MGNDYEEPYFTNHITFSSFHFAEAFLDKENSFWEQVLKSDKKKLSFFDIMMHRRLGVKK